MSVVSVRRILDSVASIQGLRIGFQRAFAACSSEPPLDCGPVLLKKQELEGLHRLADMAGDILFVFQVAGEQTPADEAPRRQAGPLRAIAPGSDRSADQRGFGAGKGRGDRPHQKPPSQ